MDSCRTGKASRRRSGSDVGGVEGSHHNLYVSKPRRLADEINAFLRVHPP